MNTYIADFHIHSYYSRATSKQLKPEYLEYWAKIKGVNIVGTGDLTHPQWLEELKEKLEPAEPGLFRLKDKYRLPREAVTFEAPEGEVRFILSGEISNIYKKGEKVRKVHNVICTPDFQSVEKIQSRIEQMGGNIRSDGRPILGMDSKDLLELSLDVSDEIMFIPAHIWTPWFSVLGAKSGFDTIEECYEDLTKHIAAVEIGLSTDPAMNWMCSFLDKFTLLANSDAHSPEKLARNANILHCDLNYSSIREAIRMGDERFGGTISFYPQEGKYHFDGHRKCNVCLNPVETFRHGGICPKCGKKVTIGVANRVVELSDRVDILQRPNRKPMHSLIPLKEILGEIMCVGPASKKIETAYQNYIRKWGNELSILMNLDIETIQSEGDEVLAEAIRRMRNSEVLVSEGYDGEFGTIRVFADGEMSQFSAQNSLFATPCVSKVNKRGLLSFDLHEYRSLLEQKNQSIKKEDSQPEAFKSPDIKPNSQQLAAIQHKTGPALILAGPGTGKTRVLVNRIKYLIENDVAASDSILAITFTNKAAQEMRERLNKLLKRKTEGLVVTTFHALGLVILKENRVNTVRLIEQEEKELVALKLLGWEKSDIAEKLEKISELKQQGEFDFDENPDFIAYQSALEKLNAVDFDDLIFLSLQLFKDSEVLNKYQKRFKWILVDEYQDVNAGQYQLIRYFTGSDSGNVFAIGDPNQAIYGFRGADVRYIRQFQSDYPQAAIYQLSQSYRCPANIIQASSNIIAGQSESFLSGMPSDVKIDISSQATDKSEAESIARKIDNLIGGASFFSIDSNVTDNDENDTEYALSDIAILCRTRRQMPAIEKALNDHRIPYRIVGHEPFFRQESVLSLISILKLIDMSDDDFFSEQIQERFKISLDDLNMFSSLQNPVEIVRKVTDKYFEKEKDSKEIKRFTELCGNYRNLEELLEFLSLGQEADDYSSKGEYVSLMTMHASKGLEFEAVFIPGCEEGLIPYSLFKFQDTDRPEEQRLLYVAMTRAKQRLFLSHAKNRFLMGKSYEMPRSSFLDAIEFELLKHEETERKAKEKPTNEQLTLF